MDESKILELLAEYLRKTDRVLDRLDSHDVLFDKQFKRLDIAYQVLVNHSEKIESLQQQTQKTLEEMKVMRHASDALLKQVVTLSRKVKTIEGKQ